MVLASFSKKNLRGKIWYKFQKKMKKIQKYERKLRLCLVYALCMDGRMFEENIYKYCLMNLKEIN